MDSRSSADMIVPLNRLENEALLSVAVGPFRLDLQGDLGCLVETFSDAAVLDGRAFCADEVVSSIAYLCRYTV